MRAEREESRVNVARGRRRRVRVGEVARVREYGMERKHEDRQAGRWTDRQCKR